MIFLKSNVLGTLKEIGNIYISIMIEYLKVKWFKCFDNFDIKFTSWINLLVWENDAWKSSLLSVIRILKGDLYIDIDDFRDILNPIKFEIKINWNLYKFIRDFNWNEKLSQVVNILDIKNKFSNNLLNEDDIWKYIKIFWWDLRWNKWEKLRIILEWFTDDEKEIENTPKSVLFGELKNIKFEDWKQFTDIQQNFKNFIKDDVNKIWDEEFILIKEWINVNKKLSDLVGDKLKEIKKRKENEYKNNLLSTIKEIIPSIQEMKLDLNPNLWNFSSYESKVNFIDRGMSINIDKKWDWTKRRITLALFKQESLKDQDSQNIYLLDEPDTHLNLRVQQDLINTFYKLVENWHQVIFTSHSPFILNLINISDIILLFNDWEKTDKLNLNLEEAENFNETLYNLWIQNIDIFFSKYFLFYEWKTELNFFSKAYYKKFGNSIEKKFIRQIDCEWIDNEAMFLKNFCSIIWDWVRIISIVDNDYEEKLKTKWIIERLNEKFSNFKLVRLWNKEFEDEFSSEQLYNCFCMELWNNWVNSIDDLEDLKINSVKFSSVLSDKTKLTKPIIWSRLADYLNFNDLPENIKNTLIHISELT